MYIEIAEHIIKIENLYPFIEEYCRGYTIDPVDKADVTVSVTQSDIEYERSKSEREDMLEGNAVRRFSDPYLETLAVYRKIALKLIDHDILLFHGSVIAVDGEAYLFTAKSGTGKSTHTRLWRAYFGDRAVMVNDDKPLLRITDSGVIAYGTPWDGKHRLSTNTGVPLKAICALERAAENSIEPASAREVYPLIVQQTYRPADAKALLRTMTLIDRLISETQLYRLHCNMNPDAAVVSYNGMNKYKQENNHET